MEAPSDLLLGAPLELPEVGSFLRIPRGTPRELLGDSLSGTSKVSYLVAPKAALRRS